MEVRSLTEAKIEDSVWKSILYGQAGAGKTHFMREFPKPLLLLDFDDKHEPLIGVEGVDVVSYFCPEPHEAPKVWDRFWKDIKSLKKDKQYATIVIDSLTSLDKVLVRSCVIKGGLEAFARPQIQHYGDVKNWYTVLFNCLRSIDKNIIMIAHEDYKIDGDSGIHAILPLVTGSTSQEVAAVFKDTWYMSYRKGKRTLHYQEHKKCVCTSTTLTGEGSIEDPTYKKLMASRRVVK